jgi:hypothetical protein
MAERLAASGTPVRALGMRRGTANPLKILQLAEWLKKSKHQVIQTWMYHADLIAGRAAYLPKKLPVVCGIHHTNLGQDQNKRTKSTPRARGCRAFFLSVSFVARRLIARRMRYSATRKKRWKSSQTDLIYGDFILTRKLDVGCGRNWELPRTLR